MRITPESYERHKLTTFDPSKVEHHISKSKSRAVAIIDILDKLIQNGTIPVQEARRALQRAQPSQAAHGIHQVKNSVCNFGGMRVCDLAADIEYLLEHNPTDEKVPALLDTLDRELLSFLGQAKCWLEIQKKAVLDELTIPIQSFQQVVDDWQTQLTECNLKALDTFSELKSLLAEQLPEDIFDELRFALEQLNFAAASQLIRTHVATLTSENLKPSKDEAHLPLRGRDQTP